MASELSTDSQQPGDGAASDDGFITLTAGLDNRLGKYVVARRLGQGGMGVVYEARDPLLERAVAIKVVPIQEFAPEVLERLLQEARAVARLNHPHVVTIHEIDRHDAGYYLVMELLSGGSAWDRLKSGGAIPWREATRMVIGACRGLMAAHTAGLIHRDIKPSNLLLTASGEVKLADFGLAKGTGPGDRSLTKTGNIVGTPDFMSPEQCRGEKLDDRSDLYSLGVTYYALLTGEPPFRGAGEAMQIMYAHCMRPAPDPRKLQPEIPAGCVAVLERLLAKEPAQRPSNAAALLNDLESLLEVDEGSTVKLAPVRMSRRSARDWGLLAIVLMAAIVAIGLTQLRDFGSPRPAEGKVQPTNPVQASTKTEPSRTELSNQTKPPTLRPPAKINGRLVTDLLPEQPIPTEGAVEGVAFSLDDTQLAWVTTNQHALTNYNLRTGKRFVVPFKHRVHCLSFDTTGRIIACGDASDQLRQWDTSTGQELPPLITSQGSVHAIAYALNGRFLAAGVAPYQNQGAAVHVWSLVDGPKPVPWPVVLGEVYSVAFSPDSTMLAAGGKDGSVRLWDVATQQIRQNYSLLPKIPEAVAFSADGRYLAVALVGENAGVLLWDLKHEDAPPVKLSGPTKSNSAVGFTPDSRAVVCGGVDGTWFWNVETGAPYQKPLPNASSTLQRGLAFAHDGSVLVTGSYAGNLQVWHQKSWPNHTGRLIP